MGSTGQASSWAGSRVTFGPFTANLRTGELRKHDIRIRIPGRPFSILTILLERAGEVVTRDEIRERLWGEDTFVDFENTSTAPSANFEPPSATRPRLPATLKRSAAGIAFQPKPTGFPIPPKHRPPLRRPPKA